eukprot:m.29244 g.29244  ORF g.29244 m.29244 type:complete len:458 (+) comp6133_c0_seq1:215-1588(+)
MFRRKRDESSSSLKGADGVADSSLQPLECCHISFEDIDKARSFRRPSPSSRIWTTIEDIITHAVSLNYYRTYILEQGEIPASTVDFLFACMRFKNEAPSLSLQDRVKHVEAILEGYVTAGEVGVDENEIKNITLACRDESKSIQCFDGVITSIASMLSRTIPLYLQSPQHAQQCVDFITQPDIQLEDVVYNDDFLVPFMTYLDERNASVLIHFWLLADNFLRASSNMKPHQIREDVNAMYKRFLSPQAFQPLGVAENVRDKIATGISSENDVSPSLLEDIEHIVYTAMRVHFLPLFLNSDTFAKFVHDSQKKAIENLVKQHEEQLLNSNSMHNTSGLWRDDEVVNSITKYERMFSERDDCLGYVDKWGIFVHDKDVALDEFLVDDQILLFAASRAVGGLKSALTMKSRITPQEHLEEAFLKTREIVQGVLNRVATGNRKHAQEQALLELMEVSDKSE